MEAVIAAATALFCARGFRRTQVADVMRAVGMSAGSAYTYAASKEALFHACLIAASPNRDKEPWDWEPPLRTPTEIETGMVIQRGIKALSGRQALSRALKVEHPADVRAELAGIIGDYYDRTAESRVFQMLLERSAPDRPELFEAFFGDMRRPALDGLRRYLAKRIAGGYLREVPDVATTARLILETQAWFSRHRHGDQDASDVVDDATARATVIDVLVAGLVAG
jgi:AcrR family transcriptional regulator